MLFAFSLIGLAIYGIFNFFIILFTSDIKIIATFFAFVTAITGTLITQYYIKVREQKNALRDKKIEIYNKFIDLSTRMIINDDAETDIKKPDNNEMTTILIKFQSEIILWASPGVINAFLNFRLISAKNPDNTFIALSKLYQEFRKDIGLSNNGLSNNELIKIQLSNPEELDNI